MGQKRPETTTNIFGQITNRVKAVMNKTTVFGAAC